MPTHTELTLGTAEVREGQQERPLASPERLEAPSSLGALQEMNDALQEGVLELVTRKRTESATRDLPEKGQYPIQKRLDEIQAAISSDEGDIGELKVSKVPEGHPGDFSLIILGLKEPKGSETRQEAMQRYTQVDLPRIRANLEAKLPHLRFSIAGMYLNVAFTRENFVRDVLTTSAQLGNRFGNSDTHRDRRVVIDFSSPNTAKTMHVGHLRSTVIGQILKNLMEATGATVYGVNHIGDWGTQFGQLVVACELWGEEVKAEIDPDKEPVRYLSELYRRIKAAIKEEGARESTELADRSRARFAGLERGEAKIVQLWQEFRRLSLIEFDRMYKRLGITGLDLVLGESFYEDKMDGPSNDALAKGIVERDEAGALVLKFTTKVDIDAAVAAGMLVHSEEMGGLVLNPASIALDGLEKINKGELDGGVTVNVFWRIEQKNLPSGIKSSGGKGAETLTAMVQLSLQDALKSKLLTVSLAGERQPGGDKRKLITIKTAKEAGIISSADGKDQLVITDLPNCIFKTTDGRSVYITRDAAALRHRMKHFDATDVLYVVGQEQALHLKQLFEMGRRVGDIEGNEAEHVAFGMMKNKGGAKISSREGAGGLSELLDTLTDAAEEIVRRRESLVHDSTPEEIRQIAEQIAVGGLIFANIIQDISRDLAFDPEAMVKFEGQTGPYIQYTCVRLNSLLTKLNIYDDTPADLDYLEISDDEYKLSKVIAEFVDIVESSANRRAPHILAEYLLKLCGEFNNLYTSGSKLKDLDDKRKKYYLSLYKSVHQVLKRGMELLNIPIPEKM